MTPGVHRVSVTSIFSYCRKLGIRKRGRVVLLPKGVPLGPRGMVIYVSFEGVRKD